MASRPKQRNLGRLSEIAQVAVRHGFGYLVEGRRHSELEGSSRGRHLRDMLDELGPTFVKFGQLLSTRPDIVPPDIVAELRGLQDDVRPFPFGDIEQTIQEDLGQPIARLFTEFEEKVFWTDRRYPERVCNYTRRCIHRGPVWRTKR